MSYPEYYEILQIKPDASQNEIKQAYRKLAKNLHPDTHKNDKKSEEKLKKVNEAYNVLKDVGKRAEYDYFGKQALEAERQSAAQAENTMPREQPPAEKVIIKKVRSRWYYLYFFINKLILLSILVAYGWLLYINTDKNEPYNIVKTLINTSDYLIKEIPDKTKYGAEVLQKKYEDSRLQEKFTFYLVKSGNTALVKMLTPVLDLKAFDHTNNMHSVLMSSPNGKMTEYLLSQPHDISYVAKDGSTALEEAVKRGDADSVSLLLQNGAHIEDLFEHGKLKLVTDEKISNILKEHIREQIKREIKIRSGNKPTVISHQKKQ